MSNGKGDRTMKINRLRQIIKAQERTIRAIGAQREALDAIREAQVKRIGDLEFRLHRKKWQVRLWRWLRRKG